MFEVDRYRLRELIRGLGKDGLALTSIGAGISISALQKILAGRYFNRHLRPDRRERLCEFFNVSEQFLFKVVDSDSGQRPA